MRVIQINEPGQREACLARLCADTFGSDAGLTPLLRFAGISGVLFEQQAARVLALVDESSRPLALALLVLDKANQGMTPMLMVELDNTAGNSPAMVLVHELAQRAPLRVDVQNAAEQKRFEHAGITRWFTGAKGIRVGLNEQHPATGLNELSPAFSVDDDAVAQSLKQDRKLFESYKQRFMAGLEDFPATL